LIRNNGHKNKLSKILLAEDFLVHRTLTTLGLLPGKDRSMSENRCSNPKCCGEINFVAEIPVGNGIGFACDVCGLLHAPDKKAIGGFKARAFFTGGIVVAVRIDEPPSIKEPQSIPCEHRPTQGPECFIRETIPPG